MPFRLPVVPALESDPVPSVPAPSLETPAVPSTSIPWHVLDASPSPAAPPPLPEVYALHTFRPQPWHALVDPAVLARLRAALKPSFLRPEFKGSHALPAHRRDVMHATLEAERRAASAALNALAPDAIARWESGERPALGAAA